MIINVTKLVFEHFVTICDAIKQNESEVKKKIKFYFLVFAICVLFKLQFGENPMEIGQLVLKRQTVEGLQKQ